MIRALPERTESAIRTKAREQRIAIARRKAIWTEADMEVVRKLKYIAKISQALPKKSYTAIEKKIARMRACGEDLPVKVVRSSNNVPTTEVKRGRGPVGRPLPLHPVVTRVASGDWERTPVVGVRSIFEVAA